MDLDGYGWIWIDMDMDIWIYGYMDMHEWIYGYMNIWMYINDGRVLTGGERAKTPPHPIIYEGPCPSNSPSI